jgi:hypothetical protein
MWSIHELREMFNRTGWATKPVTGGLCNTTPDAPLSEAKSVLMITTKSKQSNVGAKHFGASPSDSYDLAKSIVEVNMNVGTVQA